MCVDPGEGCAVFIIIGLFEFESSVLHLKNSIKKANQRGKTMP